MNAITEYFRQSVEELHQVRWPTRQQAVRLSAIVIGFSAATSLVFGLVDYGLSELVRFLISSAV